MTSSVEAEVSSYLREVSLFAQALPPERRAELLLDLEMHLDEARDAGEMPDLDAARAFITRMGAPESLVQSALEDEPQGPADLRPDPARRAYRDLTWGSFMPPLVGWVIGAVSVWVSPHWPRSAKWVAALAFPGGPLGALLVSGWLLLHTGYSCGSGSFGTATSTGGETGTTRIIARTCTTPTVQPWVAWVLTVLILGASVMGPMFVRAHHRRTAGQPLA